MFSSAIATTLAAAPYTAWGGPGFGWWVFLIPIFWIAVFVLIFALVGRRWRHSAALRGGYGGPGWANTATRSAEQTLAQRYANGDIDEVKYRARLEVLRANRSDGV